MSVPDVFEDLRRIRDYYSDQYKNLLQKKSMQREIKQVKTTNSEQPIRHENRFVKHKKQRVELKHHSINFTKSKYQLLAELEHKTRRKGLFLSRDELHDLFILENKNVGQKKLSLCKNEVNESKKTLVPNRNMNMNMKEYIQKHKMKGIGNINFMEPDQLFDFIQNEVAILNEQYPKVKLTELSSLSIDLDNSCIAQTQKHSQCMPEYQIRNKIKLMINNKVQKYAEKSKKLLEKFEMNIDEDVHYLAMRDILDATMSDRMTMIDSKSISSESDHFSVISPDSSESLYESEASQDEQILRETLASLALDWEEVEAEGTTMTQSYKTDRTMWINYMENE